MAKITQKKKNKQSVAPIGAIALIIAYVLWGINTPLIKLGLEDIPISIFLSIKILAAAIIILPFAIKTWKPLRPKTYFTLIASAVLWVSVGNFAFYSGLELVPSINSALISLLGPLLLFVLSVEFLKEKFSLRAFIGVVIAFTGSAVLIGQPFSAGDVADSTQMLGNLLLLVAVSCHVIATIMVKPELKNTSAYQATLIHLVFGVIPIALFGLSKLDEWRPSEMSTETAVAIGYGVIAVTLANFLLVFGLKRMKATKASAFYYIQPLTTIAVAIPLLGEHPDVRFVGGATLIFLGVYMAEARLPHRVHIHYRHHHH